ncbi:MAG: carbohydrate ABC transporter permease [Anaerocolumna sp.]
MIKSKTAGSRAADVVIYMVVILMTMMCLLPLVNMVALSFSDNAAASANLVGLLPVNPTLKSYETLIGDSQFIRSFLISVVRVVLGTIINIFLTVLMAYPLSKSKKEFKAHDIYMNIIIVAMLFSGGMIPLFLTVKNLHLIDTLWALILPGAVPIFSVILLSNFFKGVPKSLEEASQVDGAGAWTILFRVYLPISLPAIATITLFAIVGHWNDYMSALIYIKKSADYPLMTYIQQFSVAIDLSTETDPEKIEEYMKISSRTLGAAKIIVATLPILCIYPFMQKYFIHGIIVGSVKE